MCVLCVCMLCVSCVCVLCVCVCVIYIYKLNILSAHTISCHARRLYEKRLEEGKVNKRKAKDEIIATSDEEDPPEDKPPAKKIKPVKYPPAPVVEEVEGIPPAAVLVQLAQSGDDGAAVAAPVSSPLKRTAQAMKTTNKMLVGGGSWHHLQRQALGVFLLLFVVLRSGSPPHAHQSLKAALFFLKLHLCFVSLPGVLIMSNRLIRVQ